MSAFGNATRRETIREEGRRSAMGNADRGGVDEQRAGDNQQQQQQQQEQQQDEMMQEEQIGSMTLDNQIIDMSDGTLVKLR